jgi:hypothetical protein
MDGDGKGDGIENDGKMLTSNKEVLWDCMG